MAETAPWIDELFIRLTRDLFRPPLTQQRLRFEVEGIARLLELSPRASLLVLASGAGTVAIELAGRGYEVTGLEPSESLLESARQQAQSRGVSMRWVRRDLRRILFRSAFDAVYAGSPVLGLSDQRADDLELLRSAWQALKPGGVLLLDLPNRELLARDFVERTWAELDGARVLERQEWDLLANVLRLEWRVLLPGGREVGRESRLRLYPAHEVAILLQETGFEEVEAWGDYDGRAYGLWTPRLLLRARRPGLAPGEAVAVGGEASRVENSPSSTGDEGPVGERSGQETPDVPLNQE
ncbi:class I SAM-dependent methyltransferase [Thermomicrobiaceae bacterium CFH 74404]|uniref:Class I SAM-dependent methyltransferase n=1 Tax=Thermalbibacter longus TaxID=2951981 RepID=A0AA42BB71_9BACT|nr:class I SAM-dependent methyltransferase [Thermalbibacter longus]MCM8750602.1 class I SAM-dependent methyltransferase [Thermalbibacter longus]